MPPLPLPLSHQVLAELGSRIKDALGKLQHTTVIDEEALDAVLKEICAALLYSDVNIRIVQRIRQNIKRVCDLEELAAGTNKRKMIEQTVFDQLVLILEGERKPYKLKKGKRNANVIMFVGLQVRDRSPVVRQRSAPCIAECRTFTPSPGERQDYDLHEVLLPLPEEGLENGARVRGHLPRRCFRSAQAERHEDQSSVLRSARRTAGCGLCSACTALIWMFVRRR
eukprot:SAG31_NODE_6972_length_1830_cov_1.781051_2_plen_225_part_00